MNKDGKDNVNSRCGCWVGLTLIIQEFTDDGSLLLLQVRTLAAASLGKGTALQP